MQGSGSTDQSRPPGPRCLQCGYTLYGLSGGICPECGRNFDPADPKTVDTVRRTRYRLRRLRRRLAVVAIAVLVALFAPQGIWRGELEFTCIDCRERTLVSRFQLLAPRWLRLSYPGFHWRSLTNPSSGAENPCSNHHYSVFFRNRIWHTRFASSTDIPEIAMLRGQGTLSLVPENASAIMRTEIARHLVIMVDRSTPSRKVPFAD